MGHLADNPERATRFAPTAQTRSGYQAFNVEVVWPLEQLQRRGFIETIERIAADTGGADAYWTSITAALTPAGRDAAAGHPRNSLGLPEIPEA